VGTATLYAHRVNRGSPYRQSVFDLWRQ